MAHGLLGASAGEAVPCCGGPGRLSVWSRAGSEQIRGVPRMRITDVKTYLVAAYRPGGWAARNWCIVEVHTDEGITGIGEGSGWPRVIQTAIEDFKGVLIGEDPGRIERLWQKMLIAMMGHGMTGVVGGGAMTAIEMALWDILGKSVNKPICDLLGGRIRDTVRTYAHAGNIERA